MNTRLKIVMLCLNLIAGVGAVTAQSFAVKSNLFHDLGMTANLGMEAAMSDRWTFELSGDVNAWSIKHHGEKIRWKRWMVLPEWRYWFCEKFQGNFMGIHLIGGQFNVGNIGFLPDFLNNRFHDLRDERWQGWGAGAGITFGHAWALGKHWNIEAEIGVGWIYSRYDRYPCADCGDKIQSDKVHNYVGPTKAAVNLVYLF